MCFYCYAVFQSRYKHAMKTGRASLSVIALWFARCGDEPIAYRLFVLFSTFVLASRFL